jgi:hypothetical protein
MVALFFTVIESPKQRHVSKICFLTSTRLYDVVSYYTVSFINTALRLSKLTEHKFSPSFSLGETTQTVWAFASRITLMP